MVRLREARLLRENLELRGVSQADLARACGRSRQFVSMLANGDRSSCTAEVAAAIERRLDLAVGTLFVLDKFDDTELLVHDCQTAGGEERSDG